MAKIFVEKLVNLDFTYFHLTRGLVGETLLVDLTLAGDQDDQGMVLDFSHVKRLASETLEDAIDHKLVLPLENKLSQIKLLSDKSISDNTRILLNDMQYQYELSMPKAGFCALPVHEINTETLTTYLLSLLYGQAWWVKSWRATLTLQTENLSNNTPFFQYTHGLPKHDGACQRIAHGHRSKLEVYRNDALDLNCMEKWCSKWRDIYLGNRQDIIAKEMIGGVPSYRFAYSSAEGYYQLDIPQARAYLLETETTIENIAQHLADTVSKECMNGHQIETRVYEGYQKGAIGFAQNKL